MVGNDHTLMWNALGIIARLAEREKTPQDWRDAISTASSGILSEPPRRSLALKDKFRSIPCALGLPNPSQNKAQASCKCKTLVDGQIPKCPRFIPEKTSHKRRNRLPQIWSIKFHAHKSPSITTDRRALRFESVLSLFFH